MKERPILFSAPMVRAILAGTKTQTRRVVKPQPSEPWLPIADGVLYRQDAYGDHHERACPYGKPGDRLWVREAWKAHHVDVDAGRCEVDYRADSATSGIALDRWNLLIEDERAKRTPKWRPSIHMPRWASRITLEITDVRVERVQEISEADAEAEGVDEVPAHGKWVRPDRGRLDHWQFRKGFCRLWDSINAARGFGWDQNPWVWAVTFKRIEAEARAAA